MQLYAQIYVRMYTDSKHKAYANEWNNIVQQLYNNITISIFKRNLKMQNPIYYIRIIN